MVDQIEDDVDNLAKKLIEDHVVVVPLLDQEELKSHRKDVLSDINNFPSTKEQKAIIRITIRIIRKILMSRGHSELSATQLVFIVLPSGL